MKKYIYVIAIISIAGFAQSPVQESPADIDYELIEPYEDQKLTKVEDIVDSIQLDTKKLEQRTFASNLKQKYKSEEFIYSMSKPRESAWDKIKRKLSEFLSDMFNSNDVSKFNQYTEWFLQAIAVGILGLVLYWFFKFLMGKEGGFFFSKKNKTLNPEEQTIKENIHQINFEQLIATYETEHNYRYAVRYQFLHLLKIFTDKHLIEWDPDKTNVDYMREIEGSLAQRPFQRLSKIFEYVWYGEFEMLEGDYEMVKASFNELKQLPNE